MIIASSGVSGQERAELQPELLDVEAVARLCGCSAPHVRRLADAGRMPAPVKVGALVRWNRRAMEAWIAGGCLRTTKGGAR
jgi:excisionase family DNA binding protein